MDKLFPVQHAYLIPLLPLAAAAVAGFACTGPRKRLAHWPIWISVLASAVLSVWVLLGMLEVIHHPEQYPQHAQAVQRASHTGALPAIYAVTNFYTWIAAGEFRASAGFLFDPLTAVMLCVVCGVGFLICVFAAGYMKGEDGYFRFFAYLGLFIFMMTVLVMGENLVMLYLGWEGVGLCSYLLIGYYYERPSAREAAKKAFLVNRVGDFGFALGIMLSFLAFGTVSYFGDPAMPGDGLLEKAAALPGDLSAFQQTALQWIPFLLMLGAFGKSAQFPLYVWLPDAMEGPTPVSALIHAATMVTAGVYMIARCSTLFVGNQAAMLTVAAIGTFTAVLAATIALRQFDLKKILAYSTISQLGFMFVGVGLLAPVAGIFHLVTHAFFKALLFLSSGVVMHAMMGELDLRKMSGLKTLLPKTRIVMLIGCAALAGFPLLSGFWSKDEIVHAAQGRSTLIWLVLLGTAFLTAYYTFRLYFRVFEGPTLIPTPPAHDPHHATAHAPQDHGVESHGQAEHHHNHEPAVMMVPLYLLAVGALLAGVLNLPFGGSWAHQLGHFLGHSPSFSMGFHKANALLGAAQVNPLLMGQPAPADEPTEFSILPLLTGAVVAIAGIFVAHLLHLKDRSAADRLAARFPRVVRVLDHKYWVDEIYQYGIVEPLRAVGRGMFAFDRWVIDGLVWLFGFVPQVVGFTLKLTVQRGRLQGYAAAMLAGIAVILLLIFL
ncbi:NADH-quinone oxidoreductase subunit L [Fontivita pretiosa]|uniref:NADH-quinone oxidoreductase subunit L n=1 Tax=Fontivita pretiosa TaxID=2989684 RepID=UPI003D16A30D